MKSRQKFGFLALLLVGVAVLTFILWMALAHADTIPFKILDGNTTIATGTLSISGAATPTRVYINGVETNQFKQIDIQTVSGARVPIKIYINGNETGQFDKIDLKTRK